jgi:hypothetical protein
VRLLGRRLAQGHGPRVLLRLQQQSARHLRRQQHALAGRRRLGSSTGSASGSASGSGLQIGIIAGIAAVATVLVAGLFYYRRRRSASASSEMAGDESLYEQTGVYEPRINTLQALNFNQRPVREGPSVQGVANPVYAAVDNYRGGLLVEDPTFDEAEGDTGNVFLEARQPASPSSPRRVSEQM